MTIFLLGSQITPCNALVFILLVDRNTNSIITPPWVVMGAVAFGPEGSRSYSTLSLIKIACCVSHQFTYHGWIDIERKLNSNHSKIRINTNQSGKLGSNRYRRVRRTIDSHEVWNMSVTKKVKESFENVAYVRSFHHASKMILTE